MRVIIGILVVLLMILMGCSATTPPVSKTISTPTTQSTSGITASATEQPTSSTPTKADNSIRAGMYKAGKDIQPGEYVLFANGGLPSYFEVTNDSSGKLESIITNDNYYGNRYVSIADGQYIEFSNAYMLKVADSPILQAVGGKYQEGMYKVGRDITAGEYKVVAERDMAYFEVDIDLSGSIDSIVANDNFSGEKYITIENSQYITLSGCHIVK